MVLVRVVRSPQIFGVIERKFGRIRECCVNYLARGRSIDLRLFPEET